MAQGEADGDERKKTGLQGRWWIGFAFVYLAALAFIVVSGTGYRLGGWGWDFETVAQLGEAFGGLSALMAGLAAYFTLQALQDERAETKLLRARDARRDALDAERDRVQRLRVEEERLRDLELTFFRMLELRRDILTDVKIGVPIGIAAFKSLRSGYNGFVNIGQYKNQYTANYTNFDTVLGHYFRFTYHIMKFAKESFDFGKAYFYIRILRAQLSSGEQFMIALNAMFGGGQDKMLPLINEFGLLHNMPEGDKERLIALNAGLEQSAFEPAVAAAQADSDTA